MAIYSLSQRTGPGDANTVTWELQASATDQVVVLEIGYMGLGSALRGIALGRPSERGVSSSGVAFLPNDPSSPASTATGIVTGWTVVPPLPSVFLRRWSLSAGGSQQGVVWRFPEGLTVPVNGSLAIFQLLAATTGDVWCEIDE